MKKIIISLLLLGNILQAKEIKVLFANDLIAEWSIVQPYSDWFLGKDEEVTSLSKMYDDGWNLIQIVKLNDVASSKQFWIYMER